MEESILTTFITLYLKLRKELLLSLNVGFVQARTTLGHLLCLLETGPQLLLDLL